MLTFSRFSSKLFSITLFKHPFKLSATDSGTAPAKAIETATTSSFALNVCLIFNLPGKENVESPGFNVSNQR